MAKFRAKHCSNLVEVGSSGLAVSVRLKAAFL
jgi:hypothetical protein